MVFIMKQFINLLMLSFISMNNSYADEQKITADENAAANVLNSYYQEFNKEGAIKKKCSIDPDIFLINTSLNNYYANYLNSTP